MVELLAAVGAALSAFVALAHGVLVWMTIADAAGATCLAAYLTLLPLKKRSWVHMPAYAYTGRQVSAVPWASFKQALRLSF
jgi:hypothetical protein